MVWIQSAGADTPMDDYGRKIVLAKRIAEALRYYGGFIYEDDIDNHSLVMEVLRESGTNIVLHVAPLDPRKRIYAIVPVDRRCKMNCTTNCRDDEACLTTCLDKCRRELVEKIAGVLERYAERRNKS